MHPRPPRIRALAPLRLTTFRPSLHPHHLPQQTRAIKTIQKKPRPPSRFNKSPTLPILTASPAAALARRRAADTLPLRAGALATKKGMTALYDAESGRRTPCTVLQLDRVQVIGHKTAARNGYFAVCVGAGWRKPKAVGRAMLGVYAKAMHTDAQGEEVGIAPKKAVREFRVRDESGLADVGKRITANWFQVGQFVDTRAKNKGKGFAGGMKRFGWGGQPASHGTSLTHRSMGSAGGSQGSGSRVHPGKKMPGRMGGIRHTIQNLKVLMTDEANGLVVVNGCVSGPKGGWVMIQDALKKPWPRETTAA